MQILNQRTKPFPVISLYVRIWSVLTTFNNFHRHYISALAWNGNGTGKMNLHARIANSRTTSLANTSSAASVEYFASLANFPTPSGQDAHDQMNMVLLVCGMLFAEEPSLGLLSFPHSR